MKCFKAVGSAVLLGAGQAFCFAAGPEVPAEAPAALLDGRPVVLEREVADWQAYQPCYGADALVSRQAGFLRLLEARLAEEVMRAGGGPVIAAEDLQKEEARIDAETQAPLILGCIKKTLAGGLRYRDAFVRPVLAESLFRRYLMEDRKVQAGPLGKINKAQALLAAGKSLKAAGAGAGLQYSTHTYTREAPAGEGGPEAAGPMRWTPWEPQFIDSYLKDLKPGAARREPVETDSHFQLVRLLSADGKKWTFETLLVPKTTQEELFAGLKKKTLEVADPELRAWLASIRGNPRLSSVEVK